jgi:hypothetical protein
MRSEKIVAAISSAERAVEPMAEGPRKTAAFQAILSFSLWELSGFRPNERNPKPRKESTGRRSAQTQPNGTTGRILGLIEEGVFGEPRSLAETRQILAEKGWQYRPEDLGTPLTRLVQRKHLRRSSVTESGKKIWRYSIY